LPTLEENLNYWDRDYDWTRGGEEWSSRWGSSESQWWGTLMARIHAFLPCESILEIAPGYGRWTHYLKDLCKKLTVVDISERCIQACQERFAGSDHIRYAVNDGKSLAMVPDESIDFVFSFDSLVHAEAEVLQAYLAQLAHKLKPNGIGWIHHSNAAHYKAHVRLTKHLRLSRGRRFLAEMGLLVDDCGRALSMSAPLFDEYCTQAGLQCISQELINWEGRALIDSFSVFTRRGSIWERPKRVIQNRSFISEARSLAHVGKLYEWPQAAAESRWIFDGPGVRQQRIEPTVGPAAGDLFEHMLDVRGRDGPVDLPGKKRPQFPEPTIDPPHHR